MVANRFSRAATNTSGSNVCSSGSTSSSAAHNEQADQEVLGDSDDAEVSSALRVARYTPQLMCSFLADLDRCGGHGGRGPGAIARFREIMLVMLSLYPAIFP